MRLSIPPFLCALILIASSCARLPPGQVASIAPEPGVRVFLLRGFQDWYSGGVDTLAEELQSRNLHAEVFRQEQWPDVESALTRETPSSSRDPLVLIGFSYGADDAISIAHRLDERHIAIDLLVTIDPVTPGNVPPNVKRCVNFFESNHPWDALPWLRGIPLHRDERNPLPLENINIRDRPDLTEPDTSHATIAGNEKVHGAIIDLVEQTRGKY